MSTKRKPDVVVANHGSVIMITPRTQAAREWVDENVGIEDWQWIGGAFACEPRMLGDLVNGMRDAGLGVA